MDGNSVVAFAAVLLASVVGALVVLWLCGVLLGRSKQSSGPQVSSRENTVLLRHGVVEDHDVNFSDLLAKIEDWFDLRAWLNDRFVGLPEHLPDDATSTQSFQSRRHPEDAASITLSADGGVTRVTLNDPVLCQPADRHQTLQLQVALAEDRTALEGSPCAIWKTTPEGDVTWRNDACQRLLGDKVADIVEGSEIPQGLGDTSNARLAVERPQGDGKVWFDVHLLATERCNIYYASDVSNAVQAEAAQREFVQTLTKTFANLTTGLAIFDRNKQLALFNPALVDLTLLPAEFLSGRPSLMSFFDNLRDRQVMPEPKSYSEWRAQINAMIETATDGLYQETWSLPSDVTYRVTGRPHPDGAVAFLFEDITAEISLTRRFRAQNDLRQSVLDMLDHAVAVIAANNVVIFCNATWTDMFGVDPDTSFAELGIRDLVAICRQKYPHPDFWHTVEVQTTCNTLSHQIEDYIEMNDATLLHCRLVPASGGAAIICRPVEKMAETATSNAIVS